MDANPVVIATLFVHGRQLQRWRLLGNTLSIRMHHRAEQLFPVNRLRRVVFIERAPGEIGALWRLLEMGVGVSFLGAGGRLIGAFYAPAAESSLLPLLAERLMHDSALRQWFAQWQEDQARHLLRDIELHSAGQAGPVHPLSQESREWMEGLTGVLLNDVAAEFQLDSVQRPSRRLINTLQALLMPWVMGQAGSRLARRHEPDSPSQRYCRGFDAFSELLENHMRRMLLQLEMRADEWL